MKKIWLVGSSEGIGRALALALAKENHFLILSGRNQQRLDSLSTELMKNNLSVSLDVTDKTSILKAWDHIQASLGAIDSVIYCAGYYNPMPADDMDLDDIEKMIDVNLTGALRILNLVIPQFINQKQGHIVLIGSIAGYRGLPNSMGYGASKAGLIHLAENLCCDLSKYNITVQIINPGFVKTRLTALNTFTMPSLISADQAAKQIIQKMKNKSFESRFPLLFANSLKFLSKLPYGLYFKIVKAFMTRR